MANQGPHVNVPNVDATSYSATSNIDTPQGIILSATHTEISSSPIPSPELLKGYAELIPDSPERFMRIVEREQENRFENDRTERSRVEGELDLKRRGQLIAFLLVVTFLIVGTILAVKGKDIISYVMFGMTMIPAAALFYKHK